MEKCPSNWVTPITNKYSLVIFHPLARGQSTLVINANSRFAWGSVRWIFRIFSMVYSRDSDSCPEDNNKLDI